MIQFKQNFKKATTTIALFCIGITFLGCAYSEVIRQDLINTVSSKTNKEHFGKAIVYGISFKRFNTILSVKKFGLIAIDEDTVRLSHGLSYSIDLNEIRNTDEWELDMILKQHYGGSLKQFTEEYSSKPPIFPKSNFKAVTKNLGQKLFQLASRAKLHNRDYKWNSSK